MPKRIQAIISGTGIQPRPYQTTIVTKTTDMFGGRYVNGADEVEPAARSVMIESPTGSGKTVMGFIAVALLKAEYPDLAVGWVAMRRDLLRQAAKANQDLGLNIPDIHFTSMFEKNPEALVQANQDGRKVLMVVDEAQHDAANSMAHLHNIIEPKFILGLTATPFRTDRVKLCFDKVVKDAGIHSLIQDGYLARYHHFSIPKWDVETVADHYCSDPERWGRSIFYFLTKTECRQLRDVLIARGHFERYSKAVRDKDELGIRTLDPIVDGDSDRERQLAAYLNQDSDKLINCMVLTEGFDDPSLQTVWVRDSGKGTTMQMAGRVFRQFPTLPFKQVVQSKQTRWPMIRTAMPDQQYLWQTNEWRSLTVNPHLQEINNRARMAIAQTEVTMPKYVTDRAKAGRARRVRF
jgi:superfamily II DNA or RNA helicase